MVKQTIGCAVMALTWCASGAVTDLAARQAPASPASEQTMSREDEAARATFDLVCGACHEAAVATTTLRTPQEWTEVVEMMVSFGAGGSQEQFQQIERYLNRRYGKVNLNRASAEEIALVLSLTPEVAQAVVDYRGTTRFTAADDLLKVIGITSAKVEEVRDKLQF